MNLAELRVASESFQSHLRLQSALSRTYLCFNRRGRLTVKVSTHHYDVNKKLSYRGETARRTMPVEIL